VTHSDQSDDPLDSALQQAAQDYHRPPDAVPTEAMWAVIHARRVQRRHGTASHEQHGAAPRLEITTWRRGWRGLAAAVLLVGVGGIGGWWAHRRLGVEDAGAARRPDATVTLSAPSTPVVRSNAAYRVAVTRDLTQAEALFTAFRGDARASRDKEGDAQLASWARDLLTNTRLLLDSPAASDPQRRQLLEDLELVLVQMVELGPGHRLPDRPMIDRTLDRDHVLTRLHNAVPVGSVGL
jgi:hypothetical protein